jgi:hypothetical protein
MINNAFSDPIFFRILTFCMVPLGIYLLVKTIRMLKKTFNGNILLDQPFEQKQASFHINSAENFAIWQKGQLFRKTPVGDFKLQVLDEKGSTVKLKPTGLNIHKNGWDTGRTQLKNFSAGAGTYTLKILDEPEEGLISRLLPNVLSTIPLPVKSVDTGQYFIQIRESQPIYVFLLAIPLFTLSGFLMIIGFVAGIVGPQIAIEFGLF